jgi:MEDS: MEthanogen/methylotroph, DcmR Sensory domain
MYSSHATRSGVGFDGLFQCGDHACHFFCSADDLSEILVPYFKTGLERNEFCIWVTGSPYGKDRAVSEMRAAMSDFDRRSAAGQIEIFGQDEWYAKLAVLSTAEKVQGWLSRKDEAVALGYAGLRGSGNTPFLDEASWDDFLIYERAIDEAYKDQRIIGLCSYPIHGCSAAAVVDVTHCHRLGLAKRRGRWDLIEVRRHGCEISAQGHDPPAASAWQGEEVRRVIEDQLAMIIGADSERLTLEGGYVHLSGSQAAKLGVLISEFVSNATRYGALSSTQGKLAVRWHVVANGSRHLHIQWTESGMSSLTIPDKIGRGTQLLAAAVENCVRVFNNTGMVCKFELNLESNHLNLLPLGTRNPP